MSHTPVHEDMNLAETEQAIRENSAALHQAEVQENVARTEIQVSEGQQKDSLSKSANIDGAPSGGEVSASGQGKALSTEGGVYSDIALEVSGIGGVAKLAKDGVELVRDMDPGKFQGMQTMENFTGIKGGVGIKNSINGPHVPDMFARANLAGKSVNGEKIKGAQADESTVSTLKNTQQLKSVMSLDAQKHLGHAHAHKAQLGGQAYDNRMAPGGMGSGASPQLALNKFEPTGPTDKMLSDTGTA